MKSISHSAKCGGCGNTAAYNKKRGVYQCKRKKCIRQNQTFVPITDWEYEQGLFEESRLLLEKGFKDIEQGRVKSF